VRPGMSTLEIDEDVEAFIDGHWIRPILGKEIVVTPGHHALTFRSDGATATRPVEVRARSREVVSVVL